MKMRILPLLNISLFLVSLVSDLSRSFASDNIVLLNSNEKKPGHCTMRYAKVNSCCLYAKQMPSSWSAFPKRFLQNTNILEESI